MAYSHTCLCCCLSYAWSHLWTLLSLVQTSGVGSFRSQTLPVTEPHGSYGKGNFVFQCIVLLRKTLRETFMEFNQSKCFKIILTYSRLRLKTFSDYRVFLWFSLRPMLYALLYCLLLWNLSFLALRYIWYVLLYRPEM